VKSEKNVGKIPKLAKNLPEEFRWQGKQDKLALPNLPKTCQLGKFGKASCRPQVGGWWVGGALPSIICRL